jgi:hypothetical protein
MIEKVRITCQMGAETMEWEWMVPHGLMVVGSEAGRTSHDSHAEGERDGARSSQTYCFLALPLGSLCPNPIYCKLSPLI